MEFPITDYPNWQFVLDYIYNVLCAVKWCVIVLIVWFSVKKVIEYFLSNWFWFKSDKVLREDIQVKPRKKMIKGYKGDE